MTRVSAFIQAGNNHRRVSIGGRKANNKVWAWLNTDNQGGESDMQVKAEVMGAKTRRTNDRESYFTVELPEPSPYVHVTIGAAGHSLASLAAFGAMLVGVQGVNQMAAGEVEKGRYTLKKAREIIKELEVKVNDLPDVTLPGGVTLKHALACVAFVRRITEGQEAGKAN